MDFGIIDHVDKKAKICCAINNKHKEILHPLVKNNVYTPEILNANYNLATRILSDCYSAYNVRDFNNMGI